MVLQEAKATLGANFAPLVDWLPAPDTLKLTLGEHKHQSQRWWSDAWYKARASMLGKATLRDRCRLELQGMSHTSAWMGWVHQPESRGVYDPSEYRLLLRWWLGLPLFPGDAGRPCPAGCGSTLDPFGDHLVACHRNQLTQRHHGVRDALQGVLGRFGVTCRREVPLADRLQIPGDLAVDHLGPQPILVDLTFIHPLAPGQPRSVELCKRALVDAEQQKLDRYAVNCAAEGYSFEPLAFHCWGGMGPVSSSLVNRPIKQIVGDAQGWRKTMVSEAVRHAISSTLMKYVAQQLSLSSAVHPRWTLPEALFEEVLAAQPMLRDGPALLPRDLPPPQDLFALGTAVPTPLVIAPTAGPLGSPVRPALAGLFPGAMLELNPEYEAQRSLAGMVITCRPAFQPVAARTRARQRQN